MGQFEISTKMTTIDYQRRLAKKTELEEEHRNLGRTSSVKQEFDTKNNGMISIKLLV